MNQGWRGVDGSRLAEGVLTREVRVAEVAWDGSRLVEGVLAREESELVVGLELAETDGTSLVGEGRIRFEALKLGEEGGEAGEDLLARELRYGRGAAEGGAALRAAEALHAQADEEREAAEGGGCDEEDKHEPDGRAEHLAAEEEAAE